MVSLKTITASLFGLALLAVSNAQDARQSNPDVSEADKNLLLTAVNDVDAYSDTVSPMVCVYTYNSVAKKDKTLNFSITGCKVDPEFVGRCPDLTSFPGCGKYSVAVSTASKKPKVISIKASK